jgi:hypothetical protein
MFTILVLSLCPSVWPQEGEGVQVRPTVAFAEGTSEDYIQDVLNGLGPVPEYNTTQRWPGAQGDPQTVTWSLIPDGVNIPSYGPTDNNGNAANNELFARMDALFGGDRALWLQRVQESFDRWEELTGLDFERITVGGNEWDDGAAWGAPGSATRGDIRIGMRNIDFVGGILGFSFSPGSSDEGYALFDRWTWNNDVFEHRFFRNMVMRLAGYGIGLTNMCSSDSNQLLEQSSDITIDGPRQDDIRGAQRYYGDPFEANNDAGSAHDIGPIFGNVSFGEAPPPLLGTNDAGTSLLSIDADGEQDYYRFTVETRSLFSVSVIPVGTVYDDSDQGGGGCPGSPSPIDAAQQANLNVRVYDIDGTTILGDASSEIAGVTETISDVLLPVPGDYYLEVYETGTPLQTQLYTLALSSQPSYASFCNDGDGALALCPCANPGSPDSGCEISQGTGGVELHVVFQETDPLNRSTLLGSGFPASSTPTAVVIRSNAVEASPVLFGDGLRCVGVPLVRLAATTAFIGFSNHTLGHGAMAGTGTFYYQLWFRNTPAMFCTPGAFNLSNGRILDW